MDQQETKNIRSVCQSRSNDEPYHLHNVASLWHCTSSFFWSIRCFIECCRCVHLQDYCECNNMSPYHSVERACYCGSENKTTASHRVEHDSCLLGHNWSHGGTCDSTATNRQLQFNDQRWDSQQPILHPDRSVDGCKYDMFVCIAIPFIPNDCGALHSDKTHMKIKLLKFVSWWPLAWRGSLG